jgi:hypothetical protein
MDRVGRQISRVSCSVLEERERKVGGEKSQTSQESQERSFIVLLLIFDVCVSPLLPKFQAKCDIGSSVQRGLNTLCGVMHAAMRRSSCRRTVAVWETRICRKI